MNQRENIRQTVITTVIALLAFTAGMAYTALTTKPSSLDFESYRHGVEVERKNTKERADAPQETP